MANEIWTFQRLRGMMTSVLLALPLVAVSAVGRADGRRPDWTCYPIGANGAEFSVESQLSDAFVLRARRTDAQVVKTGALAIANINREMWTHHRLVLQVRSVNGKKVDVGATVSHPGADGKTTMTHAPGFEVSGRAWRQVVLGLDTDFGLGDRNIRIVQLKIGAWVSDWKSGEEGGIEVKGARFAGPNEVADSSVHRPGDTFLSVPSKPLRRPEAAPGALKVFFAFDNEDIVDSFSVRRKFFDRQQYGGFREKLLEHLDGQAVVTTNLAEAGAIVYSSCRKDPALAAAIVSAVRDRGTPLYAASEIADPEIEAILPCTLSHDAPEDLPPRARVVATASDALVARGPLTDAAFGIYRTCRARPGAKVRLRFADGSPAFVEGRAGKGRVAYSMICIGASLVPGKESPDAFFVRALGDLTGRDLPERDRAPSPPERDGWRAGIGEGMFGRFGWEVGSGLLAESVSSRLTVKHGAAHYVFAVPRTGDAPRKVTFAGDRADPLSLGGEVAVDGEPAFRVDMSLAYPGVRWQFRRKDIELRLANLNAFACLPIGAGRIVDLSRDEIPVAGWSAPWMLLFNGSEQDAPLLLVLQRKPARIEVLREGEAVEGLRFVAAGDRLGTITPTWIYGSAACDTTGWSGRIPDEARKLIDYWRPHALAYPIRCRESFRVDRTKGRVEMLTRYGYIRSKDEWGTVPRQYAAVPPVAWTMKGTLSEFEDGVRPTGLVTGFGDFAVKEDAAEVRWSLKLIEPDLSVLPHVLGHPDLDALANDHFEHGVKFTCGGGIKVDYVKDKGSYAAGRAPATVNCNMHGCLLGLCRGSDHPYFLTDENRRLMRRRLVWRLLEPLETMQYKMTCRWRREPVSGVDYTIYMNSPREMSTVYEPEVYGSKIIYGDSNETVMMILTCIQHLTDRFGQDGLVKANWDVISRQVPSFTRANEDWAMMATGCLEWGGPGSIDMLNCECAGMLKLARLAEIAGDAAVRDEALYRAARRACPTLARLRMLDYFTRKGLLKNPSAWRASVGYNESGAVFQPRKRPVNDIDLFEMSQGIPQDLVSLYGRYGWTELRRDYLSCARLAEVGAGLNYDMAAILAIGDDLPADELRRRLDLCVASEKMNARLKKDWPGMNTGYYIEYVLHRLSGSPAITDCRDVYLHNATYDPAKGIVRLDVTPGRAAALAVAGRPVALGKPGERKVIEIGK